MWGKFWSSILNPEFVQKVKDIPKRATDGLASFFQKMSDNPGRALALKMWASVGRFVHPNIIQAAEARGQSVKTKLLEFRANPLDKTSVSALGSKPIKVWHLGLVFAGTLLFCQSQKKQSEEPAKEKLESFPGPSPQESYKKVRKHRMKHDASWFSFWTTRKRVEHGILLLDHIIDRMNYEVDIPYDVRESMKRIKINSKNKSKPEVDIASCEDDSHRARHWSFHSRDYENISWEALMATFMTMAHGKHVGHETLAKKIRELRDAVKTLDAVRSVPQASFEDVVRNMEHREQNKGFLGQMSNMDSANLLCYHIIDRLTLEKEVPSHLRDALRHIGINDLHSKHPTEMQKTITIDGSHIHNLQSFRKGEKYDRRSWSLLTETFLKIADGTHHNQKLIEKVELIKHIVEDMDAQSKKCKWKSRL